MAPVIGIVALLTVLFLSLIITRVASVALTLTGMSEEAARFQSRSVFTGTGYTTSESEQVMGHPVRRRVVMLLMIIRSAGLISIIVSLIFSFMGQEMDDAAMLWQLLWIVIGIGALWVISLSNAVDRAMRRVIELALKRWTNLDVRDYASLLRLSGEYTVMEIQVQDGDWVAGKKLRDCYLNDEGLVVLGVIRKDGTYLGGPKGQTSIWPGDTMVIYGRSGALAELDQRRAGKDGDAAHGRAVNEQRRCSIEQDQKDAQYQLQREQSE